MMEEDKRHTDDILKEKLEGFTMPVDDDLFDAIQSEISLNPVAEEKKTNKRWPWIFGAFIGLGLLFLLWQLFSEEPEQMPLSEIQRTVVGNTEVNQVDDLQPSSTMDISAGEVIQADDLNDPVKKSITPDVEARNQKPEPISVVEAPIVAMPIKSSIVGTQKQTQPSANGSQKGLAKKTAGAVQKKNTRETPDPLTTPISTSSNEADLNEEPHTIHQTPEPTTESNNPKGLPNTNEANSTLAASNPDQVAAATGDVEDENPAIPTPQTEKGFRLSLQAGAGLSYRSLRIESNEALQAHKDDHESFGTTISAAVGVRYYFSPKLYVGAGIGYARFAERYAFHHDVITHNTTNTYSYVQVPVQVGFSFYQGKRFSAYGQAGIAYNALVSAQSSWVNPDDLQAVSHSNSDATNPFQSNTFETTLGFDIAMKLNDNWQLHLMPQSVFFLNSVYQQSTDLEQRPYAGLIQLGITRKF